MTRGESEAFDDYVREDSAAKPSVGSRSVSAKWKGQAGVNSQAVDDDEGRDLHDDIAPNERIRQGCTERARGQRQTESVESRSF